MICIFSNSEDHSTTEVMRWLHYLGHRDVLRVNSDEQHDTLKIRLTGQDLCFEYEGTAIPLTALKSVWYRRGDSWLGNLYYKAETGDNKMFADYLNYKLKEEQRTLSRYIHYCIEQHSFRLGDPARLDLNKIMVLDLAQRIGLEVPPFFIGNNKKDLAAFAAAQDTVITKALSDGLYFFEQQEKNTAYYTYTEEVDTAIFQQMPERISPSFLQRNIQKQYELRIFYLEGACYAMAICSQQNELTRTDFRKYNGAGIQRAVPFKLPAAIEEKLVKLFGILQLNTGSADMLVDKDDRFYFLEINPAGQFEMVSHPCNYNLPRKVAQLLIRHDRTYPS